jgi:hypothetical protein
MICLVSLNQSFLVCLVLPRHHSLMTITNRRSSLAATTLLIPPGPKRRREGLQQRSPHVPAFFSPVRAPRPSSTAQLLSSKFGIVLHRPLATSALHPDGFSMGTHLPLIILFRVSPSGRRLHRPTSRFTSFSHFHPYLQHNTFISFVLHISSPGQKSSTIETKRTRNQNQSQ